MKGSEKQIAWATEIRENLIKTYTAVMQMMPAADAEMMNKTIDKLNAIEYASDIIDLYKSAKFTGDLNNDWTQICAAHKTATPAMLAKVMP